MERLALLVTAAVTAAVAALLAAVSASVPAFAQQDEVEIRFELTVEGEPPAGTTFFGQYMAEGATVQLTDPDGDGVYTGSMAGGAPEAGFRIVQSRGTQQTATGVSPGGSVAVIEEFPTPNNVEGGSATLSSIVYFDGGENGGSVSATGVLEKPGTTTYMYGAYAIEDEATGERYALSSESVDLDAYVGERVRVSGDLVPGYEKGQVEGGPTLLEVRSAEPASGRETTVAFEVALEGKVPENASLYVQSDAVPGGVICTTDEAANERAGYPECRGGGEKERLEVPMAPGQEFDYRILANRGNELSESVVAEGSEVADDGLVVEASYSFDPAANGEDVNEDGVVDAADDDHAAKVSDDAKSAIDLKKNPLPITGGAALLVLLAGSGLAAVGYAARRVMR